MDMYHYSKALRNSIQSRKTRESHPRLSSPCVVKLPVQIFAGALYTLDARFLARADWKKNLREKKTARAHFPPSRTLPAATAWPSPFAFASVAKQKRAMIVLGSFAIDVTFD